jgi:transposase
MPMLKPDDLTEITPDLVRDLNRETLERLALQVVDLALHLANRLNLNSSTSSCPASSDAPYRRQAARAKAKTDKERDRGDGGDEGPSGAATVVPLEKPPAKPPGKRPGMAGHWRSQPIVATGEVDHAPVHCALCGQTLEMVDRHHVDSAHHVYDLERGDMALSVVCRKHRYFAARCACGHETVARPAEGKGSTSEGRKRDLVLTERSLVGPMLATFIAALAKRFRHSRAKVQEFLRDWLGLELSVATINRCVHEFGLASEPVVEDLITVIIHIPRVRRRGLPWEWEGEEGQLWLR